MVNRGTRGSGRLSTRLHRQSLAAGRVHPSTGKVSAGVSLDRLSLFTVALGLQSPWEGVEVAFDPSQARIDFQVAFGAGARCTCPHCGAAHPWVHDTRERSGRHLSFFQFHADLHAQVPRVCCQACDKTTQVAGPGARPNSGVSPLMAARRVTLCKALTVRQVAQWLGVSARRIGRTLDRYVEHARAPADCSAVTSVGLDETAARRGHDSIGLFHDRNVGRLLGRKAEVVAQCADAWEARGACADNLRNVCIDMSASSSAGGREHLPLAAITGDECHGMQLVHEAVDEVRRQEVEEMPQLKRSRYTWLHGKHHWRRKQLLP